MDKSFEVPPLPWTDIEAWLEVSSAAEIAADIKAYALAAVEAEREACAKLCEDHQKMREATGHPREASTARKLTEKIRARGTS